MDVKDWALTIAAVLGSIKLGFEIAEQIRERSERKKKKKKRIQNKKRPTKKRKR
ncbi:hypothetical protein [Aneurinibacillus migulanus]|uniref:Uncharacterized protein n=1 Tax=Aneurinibacillus migulanus TaxID=47500 RepID=A0A1G8NX26_ANEMI|nr:hypothetical protein [Aneurinibacillus migulanus]MED0893851.1 hypothetical protein [Aneurinibacillus migulanus]MED1614530.1 hypothetical protein [Aneurinibacillus migulanus]GED15023.1 hypothetical protein AMI01nite_30140 [Aneurinibacillus migulanus]SDI84715.1 hypothetical protein SAMN04487909_108151 [Aneurinibacillus migulanus]